MNLWMQIMIVAGPALVGVWTLASYYREQRKSGREKRMFFEREKEGRWGSVLILMGAVMFLVMGNEHQWFEMSHWRGILTSVMGVLGIGAVAEALAWVMGMKKISQ